MSIAATQWALKQPLRGLCKFVLVVLAHHANDDARCWPGLALIASECGISRSSATSHIKKLMEENLICKKSRHDEKGYRRSNIYELNLSLSPGNQRRNSQRRDIQCRSNLCRDDASLSPDYGLSNCQNLDGNIIERSLERSKEQTNIRQVVDTTRPVCVSGDNSLPACDDRVEKVFTHWQTVMNHPKAKLDKKRESKITQALKDFCVEDLCKTVDGCKSSDWHMGKKDNKQIHDGIDLIFRDAEHIEKFMGMADRSADTSSAGNDDIFAGAL